MINVFTNRQFINFGLPFSIFNFLCLGAFVAIFNTTNIFASEFKAMWVVRTSLTSKEKIDKMIETAKACNFNTVIVQIRGRGDAYYSSNLVPKGEDIPDSLFDPLEYAIQKCRENNLEVHAWMNVFYIWSESKPPKSINHIYHQHPEWSFEDSKGAKLIYQTRDKLDAQLIEGVYISPLISGVREHLLNVILEVVKNYDIDGIHLDYIRFPGEDFDYNPISRTEYMLENFLDPLKIRRNYDEIINKFGKDVFIKYDQNWKNYKLNTLSNFVKTVKDSIKSIKQNVELSAAVKPEIDLAKNKYYQDWTQWVNQGFLDFAIAMNYTTNIMEFSKRIEQMIKIIPIEKFYVGIAVYNQKKEDAFSKIYRARAYGNRGFCIFSYDAVQNDEKFWQEMKRLNNELKD